MEMADVTRKMVGVFVVSPAFFECICSLFDQSWLGH
jgi:hypothetical protein